MSVKKISRAVVLCFFAVCFASAQTGGLGAISGTVRDSSGSVVPNVSVHVVQTETNVERTVVSKSDGGFVIPNLPVGTYKLTATLSGFDVWAKQGIMLDVGANPQVDPVMNPGVVTESVTVEGGNSPVAVETRETSVAQVIDSNLIGELPLDGRNVVSLVTLSGAALADVQAANRNFPGMVNISIAGQQDSTVSYRVDGTYSNDLTVQMPTALPFPDAVNQFSVQTGSTGAETGLKSGGVVNMATKSGTNSLHGVLFDFIHNYSVNAVQFGTGVTDSLKRNQFGGTLGGKIIRNKLFFFVGDQATINRQNPSFAANQVFVPTQQVLSGDFSTILSSACRTTPITLPAPFVNNQISPSLFNPIALKFASNLPAPTNPCGATTYFYPANSNENQAIGRVDYNLDNKNNFFARYLIDTYTLPPANQNLLQTEGNAGLDDRDQNVAVGYTRVINSNMVSSLNVSFMRLRVDRLTWSSLGNVNPCAIGIEITCFVKDWVIVQVTGYFSYAANGSSPGFFNSQNFGVNESIQHTVGRHSLSYGFNLMRTHFNGFSAYEGNGLYTFTGVVSGNNNAAKGSALADFLLGNLATMTQQAPGQAVNSAGRNYGLYFQDYWRATPKLTITAGVRWEPFLPDTNKYGVDAIFDLSNFYNDVTSKTYKNAPPGFIFPGDPQSPGNQYTNSEWHLTTPRIGLAYDPSGNGTQSIRAGYNIIYDTLPIGWNTSYESTDQPFGLLEALSLPPSLANPYSATPGGNPFASLAQRNPNFVFQPNASWAGFPLHMQPLYVQHWNLSYERRFGTKLLLSAQYIGNKSVHVRDGIEVNPDIYIPGNCPAGEYGLTAPGPCSNGTTASLNARKLFALQEPQYGNGSAIGTFQYAYDGFNQDYNGLELSLNRRFARGSSAVVNYTWGHCLTDLAAGENGIDLGSVQSQTPFDLHLDKGSCSSNRTQIGNASYVGQSPKFGNWFTKAVLGEWQAALIYQFQSGAPLTISSGTDTMYQGVSSRASLLPGCDPFLKTTSRNEYFNTACFTTPAFGQVGNVGIGLLNGPSFWNVNFALTRFFPIPNWEGKQLQFRAEAFNLLNHPNNGAPVVSLTSSTFGQITAYAGTARDLQFALKLLF